VPTQSATRFLLAPISCRNEDHGNEGRALGSALRRACYALPSLSAAASGSVQLGASSCTSSRSSDQCSYRGLAVRRGLPCVTAGWTALSLRLDPFQRRDSEEGVAGPRGARAEGRPRPLAPVPGGRLTR
jgi:hypothetical protein